MEGIPVLSMEQEGPSRGRGQGFEGLNVNP